MSTPRWTLIESGTGTAKEISPAQARRHAAESNHTCHAIGCVKNTNLRKNALYCSAECQKGHWRLHKIPCQSAQYCKTLLGSQGGFEDGGPLGRNLRLFSSRFEYTLMSAFIYGLDLRRNPSGNTDSAMIVAVRSRPHSDPAARFVLEDVSFASMEVFKLLVGKTPTEKELLRSFLEVHEHERQLALKETNGECDFGVSVIIGLPPVEGPEASYGSTLRLKAMPINWNTVRNNPAYDRMQGRWRENFQGQIEHNMPNRATAGK